MPEKIIKVKGTSKRVAHKRKIHFKGKEKEKLSTEQIIENTNEYINNLITTNDGLILCDEIRQYTNGHFKIINTYLRSGKIISLPNGMKYKKERINDKINRITAFLKSAPKMQGTVYRGMRWDKKSTKEFNKFMNLMNIGSNIILPSFNSMTMDKLIAIEFTKMDWEEDLIHSIIFEIESKNGVYIDRLAEFKGEKEVLFNKDSNFKIIEIDKNSDPIKIKMVEV